MGRIRNLWRQLTAPRKAHPDDGLDLGKVQDEIITLRQVLSATQAEARRKNTKEQDAADVRTLEARRDVWRLTGKGGPA